LGHTIATLGFTLTDKLEEKIDEADMNGNEGINYEELIQIIMSAFTSAKEKNLLLKSIIPQVFTEFHINIYILFITKFIVIKHVTFLNNCKFIYIYWWLLKINDIL